MVVIPVIVSEERVVSKEISISMINTPLVVYLLSLSSY